MSERIKQAQVWFNGLPSEVQIIFYVGFSSLVSMVITDAEVLGRIGEYLSLPLTVVVNIITYLIINLKNGNTEEE